MVVEAVPPPPKPKEHIAYGLKLSAALSPPLTELLFFRHAPGLIERKHPSYTGEGRYWHAQQAINKLFGKSYEMHEWAEDCLELFCNYREPSVTGPKSAGKTTAAAIYALLFWLANPTDTAVIVCSTTVPGLRRRIWKEIKKYFRHIQHLAPEANMVESKMAIQATKNDDGNGIFGIAVAGGQTEKALGRIIGFHPKNLLIIVDEATDTPEAIDEACANLDKVEGEFQIIRLGNAKSRFDPHGKSCEPKDGWKSITVDDEFWETEGGACLHLDGTKSPNIKLGKRAYPYLLDEKDLERDAKKYGEDSPKYWRFIRGFWAPDGVENTVLTETMAVKFDIRLPIGIGSDGKPDPRLQWRRMPTPTGSLDPAFGGDRCILRFGRYGPCRDGRTRIEFTEVVPISIHADSTEPIDYQIARQVKEACKLRGVQPQHFGLDATGAGRGVAAILRREWSQRIHVVEFGGAASTRPTSTAEDAKPCNEEYRYFVTELWFAVRTFVECDQIRGMPDEDVKEFCMREYEVMAGGIIQIESKPDMKKRTNGVSPDLADADAVMVEVIRRNGIVAAEIELAQASPDRAQDFASQRAHAAALDFDAHPDCYTDPSL